MNNLILVEICIFVLWISLRFARSTLSANFIWLFFLFFVELISNKYYHNRKSWTCFSILSSPCHRSSSASSSSPLHRLVWDSLIVSMRLLFSYLWPELTYSLTHTYQRMEMMNEACMLLIISIRWLQNAKLISIKFCYINII